MEFAVILAAVLAVAHGGRPSPPTAECSGLHDGQSLLSSILLVLGYNDTCIAAALDYCSSPQEDGDFASLVEKVRGMVQQDHTAVNKSESRPRHCKDVLDSGDSGSGLRQVYPYAERPNHPVTVYCEQEVDGGGWTVFQRRIDIAPRKNFSRSWLEYQDGFGDLQSEFWLGLHLLHELTKSEQELRIDLDDYDGAHRWAKYGSFQIGSAETDYRLAIGMYSGDAGDGMMYNNGAYFSTHDNDNDNYSSINCAVRDRGGWWHYSCTIANLNGYQHVGKYRAASSEEGIIWSPWRGHGYSLKRTVMMVRPAL